MSCWLLVGFSVVVVGVIETVTVGARAMLALADFVGSAALVAVTVTLCVLEIAAGAV
jgi:hypothetical protein